MKRTPMKRAPMRRRRRSTSYSRRERDLAFMGWARERTCMVREIAPATFMQPDNLSARRITACEGEIEADHMGERGLSQKADDTTCVPMCNAHHGERTDHRGSFRNLTKAEVRGWRAEAIARTLDAWSKR